MWPENWPAVVLFDELGTQWTRAGMDGSAFGLNYAVLFARMERMGLAADAYEAMFSDIRHMEQEALRWLNTPT